MIQPNNFNEIKTIENFEQTYPTLAIEFKKIQEEQYSLFAKKMLSYGLGNIAMGTSLEEYEDVKLSLTAIWIRMNDKMNRLKNLVLKNNPNPLDNEPVIDAWVDIVNYAIIAQLVYKNKCKK
jgi:hypothetical protein